MKSFVLSPDAEEDAWTIWRDVALEAGLSVANRVESTIFEKIGLLAKMPGIGHWRRDLTDRDVKFFPVYSYMIVYRPGARPLQVVAILHGRRDVEQLLKARL
jgi:toxin ParE1/3/4